MVDRVIRAAHPPVADVLPADDREFERPPRSVADAVAHGLPAVLEPGGGVEEDERPHFRVDRDVFDRDRQFAADRFRMQHDAGPVVVLVEADQLARHAEEFQGSPRHAAERVVAALIGPAAFAVAGDAVRKAAVAVLPQVERRGLRRIDLVTESGGGAGGPFGPDGGRERIGFPFQLGAGERRERAESCFKLRFAAGADYRAVLRFEQQERPAVPHRKRPVADQIRGGASGRERELDELRVAVPVEQVKQRRAAALRGVRFDIDREIPLRMADKIERRTDAVPLKRGAEQRSERVILKLRRKYVDGALAELADGEGRRVSARAEHLPIAGEFHPDRVASGKPAGQGCRAGDGERDFFEPGIFVFFERKSGEESGGVGRAAVFVLGHEFAPGDEDAACFDETPQRLRGTRQRIPDRAGLRAAAPQAPRRRDGA